MCERWKSQLSSLLSDFHAPSSLHSENTSLSHFQNWVILKSFLGNSEKPISQKVFMMWKPIYKPIYKIGREMWKKAL